MKKLFAFLFASLMILSLAACGAKPAEPAPVPDEVVPPSVASSSEPEPEPAVPASDITIGVCISKSGDSFLDKARESMTVRAQQLDVNLKIVDSQDDPWIQNGQTYDFLTKGNISALILNPIEYAHYQRSVISKAVKEGVPVVILNQELSTPDENSDDRAWYVGTHYVQSETIAGQMMADYFKAHPEADKNHDGQIQYVMIEGNHFDFEDIFEDMEPCPIPMIEAVTDDGTFGVEELAIDGAHWDRAAAADLMKTFIASQGLDKIEAVFAEGDGMALGAIDAIKAEGYNTGNASPYIPVVSCFSTIGCDATADALDAISRGELLFTALSDPENSGIAAINIAVASVQGKEVTTDTVGYEISDGTYVWIPHIQITADNCKNFM